MIDPILTDMIHLLMPNGEYTLSSNLFQNVDPSRLLSSIKLYIRTLGTVTTSKSNNIKLYHKNELDEYELIDASTTKTNGNEKWLVFDLAIFLFNHRSVSGDFVLKNESSSQLTFYTGDTDHIEFEYYNKLNDDSNNVLSLEIPDYSFSLNHLTQDIHLTREFYSGLLPYQVLLTYSSKMKNRRTHFFPYGFKLNLLDYLIIEYSSGQLSSLVFVDKNNVEHELEPISNYPNMYYTNDGSGLLLQVKTINNIVTYELFNELSTAKKIFNSDGYLISYINEDGRTINVSYSNNSISITDYNGNVTSINYSSDISTDTILISLNNDLTYTLSIVDDLLTDISYDNETYNESLTYNNANLISVTSYDSQKILISYLNNRVSSVSKYFNSKKIEENTFLYQYLKTTITNIYGVKTFISYNSDYVVTQTGEESEDEEESSYFKLKNILSGEYSLPFKHELYGRCFIRNSGIRLEEFSNSESSYDLSVNIVYSSGFKIYKNKKYFLIATLSKPNGISFGDNRKVIISLTDGRFQDHFAFYSYTFKTNAERQTVAIPFIAPFDDFDSLVGEYNIRIESQGFADFGGVTFSNVFIIEAENFQVTSHYAIKDSLYNASDIVLENEPEHIDIFDWCELSQDVDVYNNIETRYSFKDLIRNYLNIDRETFFIWSEDLHKLIYSPYVYPSTEGGYYFRNHRNIPGLNTIYAKKTLKKQYIDNDVVKDIYSFTYLIKDTDMDDEVIYRLVTINQIGDDTYKDTSIYDENFRLIKEVKSNGDISDYFYNSDNNLVKVENSNISGVGLFRKRYIYDNKNRVIYESELSSSDIVSRGSSYINSSLSLVSSYIDEAYNVESHTYDNYYRYIKKIKKGASSNNQVYVNNQMSSLFNSSYFVIEKDNRGELHKFKIRTGTTTFTDAYVKERIMSLGTPLPNKVNIYGLRYTYDIYNRLYSISTITNSNNPFYVDDRKAIFYYFNSRPEDIENISTTIFSNVKSTSKAKLYRIDDLNASICTFYNYDLDKLSEKKISNYGTIYSFNYEYDNFDRLISYSTTFSSLEFTTEINYLNSSSELITKIDHKINDSSYVKEQYQYDALSRINKIDSYVPSYSLYSHSSKEYVYYSKDVEENNEIVHLESPLIKRIDYHRTKRVKILNNVYLPSFRFDYSTYLTYDNKGNITSIKRGDQEQVDSSTGANYLYDINNRLIREDNYELDETIRYFYDDNGNITSITHSPLNSEQVSSTETYLYDSHYKDLLTSFGGSSITYENFNPTSYNGYSFSWIHGRLLDSIINSSLGLTINNTYNHQGIRVKKVVNNVTHKYYLDDEKIVKEEVLDSNNDVLYDLTFFYGNEGIIGFRKDSTFYRYEKNVFGDIVAIYQSYNLVARYVYDAYGNQRVFDGNDNEITYSSNPTHVAFINPFRYRGYYYDNETNLYYCLSRYYNPEWRRWLNIDDINYIDVEHIDGLNLFAYCLNNPVMNTDPEGTIFISLLIAGFLAGAAISAGASIVSQGLTVGWGNINYWRVLFGAAIGGIGGLLSFSGVGIIGSIFGNAGLGFVGSIGDDLISSGGDLQSINWTKAGIMAAASGIVGALSKAGVQNSASFLEELEETMRNNPIFKIIGNAANKSARGFQATLNLYSKKLVMAMTDAIISTYSKKTMESLFSQLVSGCINVGIEIIGVVDLL